MSRAELNLSIIGVDLPLVDVRGNQAIAAGDMHEGRRYRWNRDVFKVLEVGRRIAASDVIVALTDSCGVLEIHEAEMVWPED